MTDSMHPQGGRSARSVRLASRRIASGVLCAAVFLALATVAPGSETLPGVVGDTSGLTSSIRLPVPGQREVIPASAHPFRTGEMLKFSVQYGPIHAGSAYLEVPEVRMWQGHPVFH